MKYHVTLRSRTYVIDIDGGAVTVDGERLEAHWAAIPGTPLIHLLLGKDSWTVACQQLDGRSPPPVGHSVPRGSGLKSKSRTTAPGRSRHSRDRAGRSPPAAS